MYKKTYLNWMANIHDWCISRQLWWGHRIPAWHCAVCHKITVPKPGSTGDPAQCAHCGSDKITQETDVLDTWFSSGLLPVSVFGWPGIAPIPSTKLGAPSLASETWEGTKDGSLAEEPKASYQGTTSVVPQALPKENGALAPEGSLSPDRSDFDAFYPTSLLVTGFDILFFWVARMIMLGCWFSAEIPMPDGSKRELKDSVPFKEVYIHALVLDANREKMSKVKGNVVDPIQIVKQYGTDATRFTLASMAAPGTNVAFNVARTEGYRAFANKIWNAARFIFMNVDRAAEAGIKVNPAVFGSMPTVAADAPLEARWIVAELHATAAKVNELLGNYRFDEAANVVYQFFWGRFCDWYIEIVKLRLDFEGTQVVNGTEGEILSDLKGTRAALATLVSVFEAALRLLSPFMPFLTEELWHAVYDGNPPTKSIALTRYPHPNHAGEVWNPYSLLEMQAVQELITETRGLRKEIGVEEKVVVPIEVRTDASSIEIFEGNREIVERLARVSEVRFVDTISAGLTKHNTAAFDVAVVYERTIDVPAERDRLTMECLRLEKVVANDERALNDPGFTGKAPAHIVEGRKKQLAENRLLLKKAKDALDGLPEE